jgi:raffinose/stachyose/melibiose transport system permease protein
MLTTSLKANQEIFINPLGLPKQVYLDGYKKAWLESNFAEYFLNSVIVTFVSLAVAEFLSILAAYGLGRFQFRTNRLLSVYFLIGMMIPIKLGTVNLFTMMRWLNLFNNLLSVIIVDIAMCLPLSIFVLTNFVKGIPNALEEAAVLDGCSNNKILVKIILPLIKPALATVTIMNFLPVWNDFYFPLLFLRTDSLKTIPLGVVQFFGEFQTDWNLIFSGLVIASLPTMLVYICMSKQFIEGITAGAVKG